MHPPAWAPSGGTRLDLDEFGAAFASAWSRIESRFLKLECWQAYREAETSESQTIYKRGDVEAARDVLRHEAEADRPLYEDVDRRHLEYARVRLIQELLSPYLEYELLSYRIPLIHDYGTDKIGRQTGGWLTDKPDVIAKLEETISVLRRESLTLQQYLDKTPQN